MENIEKALWTVEAILDWIGAVVLLPLLFLTGVIKARRINDLIGRAGDSLLGNAWIILYSKLGLSRIYFDAVLTSTFGREFAKEFLEGIDELMAKKK